MRLWVIIFFGDATDVFEFDVDLGRHGFPTGTIAAR